MTAPACPPRVERLFARDSFKPCYRRHLGPAHLSAPSHMSTHVAITLCLGPGFALDFDPRPQTGTPLRRAFDSPAFASTIIQRHTRYITLDPALLLHFAFTNPAPRPSPALASGACSAKERRSLGCGCSWPTMVAATENEEYWDSAPFQMSAPDRTSPVCSHVGPYKLRRPARPLAPLASLELPAVQHRLLIETSTTSMQPATCVPCMVEWWSR